MGNLNKENLGLLGTVLLTSAIGCSSGDFETSSFEDRSSVVSFEEFVEQTNKESFENGVFIVDKDIPVLNEKQLREIYEQQVADGAGLIVENLGGQAAVWPESQQRNLTYCINDNFGDLKPRIVAAMEWATGLWESAADVDFIYLSGEDANCTSDNPNVLFDVFGSNENFYVGRAFFPGFPRVNRNVVITALAFSPQVSLDNQVEGVMLHELGHVLGFRHEHTRFNGAGCFENSSFFEVTPVDRDSIMFYPECGGTNFDYQRLSESDKEGAALVYGAPQGSGSTPPPSNPPPVAPPSDSQICEGSDNSSVGQGEVKEYQPIFASAGEVTISISGTGDADLYVGLDSEPSDNNFACRPYLEGSNESCTLTIPQGGAELFIRVQGYEAAEFQLNASWSCQEG